ESGKGDVEGSMSGPEPEGGAVMDTPPAAPDSLPVAPSGEPPEALSAASGEMKPPSPPATPDAHIKIDNAEVRLEALEFPPLRHPPFDTVPVVTSSPQPRAENPALSFSTLPKDRTLGLEE